MAAMLLTSMCAFAQSGNNEPLKGDVNEDGKVDVADITALVKIIMENGGGSQEETTYYYYAGWTLPTVDNVESIIAETYPTSKTDNTQHAAGKKTTNPSTFSLASVNLYNSEAKTNYYVLVPTGHAIYDTVFGLQMGTASFTSQGTITVGNQVHTIYKSVDTTRNIGSIEIRISDAPTYYWYVGQTDPSNMSSITPVVSDTSSPGWRLIGSTIGSYSMSNPLWDGAENSIITGQSKAITYVALPNTTLKMRDGEGDVLDFWINNGTKTINNVTYTIYQTPAAIKVFNNIIF